MHDSPPRPSQRVARPSLVDAADSADAWPFGAAEWGGLAGAVRALRRLLMAALWTVGAACVQSVLLSLPGHGKKTFARLYWAVLCRLLGFRVRVIGAEAADTAGRPVVYVSNHTSWLDIPVLGGQVEACFVAKNEVGKWPVIRTIAWLGRTVYVSRRVGSTVRERDEISARPASATTAEELCLYVSVAARKLRSRIS